MHWVGADEAHGDGVVVALLHVHQARAGVVDVAGEARALADGAGDHAAVGGVDGHAGEGAGGIGAPDRAAQVVGVLVGGDAADDAGHQAAAQVDVPGDLAMGAALVQQLALAAVQLGGGLAVALDAGAPAMAIVAVDIDLAGQVDLGELVAGVEAAGVGHQGGVFAKWHAVRHCFTARVSRNANSCLDQEHIISFPQPVLIIVPCTQAIFPSYLLGS